MHRSHSWFAFWLWVFVLLSACKVGQCLEIVVDYTYDSQDFFDTQSKRDAIEAAAARYSRVITSPLLAVDGNSSPAWRIGFAHPGTGQSYQISTAHNAAADPISSQLADEYGFAGLEQDVWILYAGGRPMNSTGVGGTATGTNFETVFDDLNGPMHRGVISNSPEYSVGDLPAWGGAVAFDSDAVWHFELDQIPSGQETDFYSIALHEIGHALGLGTTWNQWDQYVNAGKFKGPRSVEAYNTDNGTYNTTLDLEDAENPHWKDGAYQSRIFAPGYPAAVGTAGDGFQDLLLEPRANFTSQLRRFELTNVDVAALEDIGWAVLDPLDLNGDEAVDAEDVNLACFRGQDLSAYFDDLRSTLADVDLDGSVQFSDFLTVARNFNQAGAYTDGDVDCDGYVRFPDFLALAQSFGSSGNAAASVPEPAAGTLLWIALCVGSWLRRLH